MHDSIALSYYANSDLHEDAIHVLRNSDKMCYHLRVLLTDKSNWDTSRMGYKSNLYKVVFIQTGMTENAGGVGKISRF